MENEKNLMQKKVAVITNNVHCERHSQYFSTIERYFVTNGWTIAENFDAHKIVICACGFHEAMVRKIEQALEDIAKTNFLEKNIILMACLTKTHEEELKKNFKGHIVPLHREELLDELIKAEVAFKEIPPVNMLKFNDDNLPLENKNAPRTFYIKISEGCLRECTFCVINKAKGYIKSVPFDEIARQIRIAGEHRRKRIELMGEDTFAYGVDIGSNIIELLEKLQEEAPGMDFYFGYLHIRWLKKYASEIISLCKKGIIKELQIGIQHVNDEMLKRMGRPVVFSEIYEIIRTIKREIPGFYMIVDIMVGFPGETDEIFDQLVEFFRTDKCFNKVKHFGYSDVKGAPSTGFKDKVPTETIARRWEILDKILGERSYSTQEQESRLDNETFRLTRFQDYFFCKNTFGEKVQKPDAARHLVLSQSDILKEDEGDFGFQREG